MATTEERFLAAGDKLEALVGKFGNYKELDKEFIKLIDEDMMGAYLVLACHTEKIPELFVTLFSEELLNIISRAMTFGYYLAITNGHES